MSREPRPICRNCGKRLERTILWWLSFTSKWPKPVAGGPSPWGRIECILPPIGKEDPSRRVRFWTGLYGLEGESKFCSRKCAIQWAHEMAPIKFEGSSGTVPDGWGD